jgi:hypothetical protein
MGRVLSFNFLRLSFTLLPLASKARRIGILKGGSYGCKEKSQKESQEEKEVKFWMWGCGSELSPP